MSAKKTVSSARAGDAREKATDKLNVKEFRDRFCIPNGVIVELLDGEELVPTEKAEGNTIIFSKEQFNAGLRLPLPALFKEFLHFSQIPPAFIHPNIVRHVRSPALPSIGDGAAGLDEGRCEGTRGGPGCMGGLLEHPFVRFCLVVFLLIFWTVFLSFVAAHAVRKEGHISQEYVVNILPRKLPKEVVPGEYYILKDLPIYKEFKEVDAEKRRALLDDREKRKNEGTLRKAPGQKHGAASPPKKAPAKKRKLVKNGKGVKEPTPPKEFVPPPITHEAEVIIEELVNPAPHSISSGLGHLAGLNHSGTSLSAVARLATLAVCATPMEEAGAESQSQPSDDPDRLALAAFGTQSEVRTHRAASRSIARD
ncbi:hypothetical protein AAG906_020709 [Vitis piasezkii]